MIGLNRILVGDAREQLRRLPDGFVDCIITSPPYFRLRNYQQEGQLGLEEHVDRWVKNLRAVLAEARRVLVSTGSVWLNLGDRYSTGREGAPAKSLLLGPERLALALIEDGWLLRNKIVWAKRNPMPSPVPELTENVEAGVPGGQVVRAFEARRLKLEPPSKQRSTMSLEHVSQSPQEPVVAVAGPLEERSRPLGALEEAVLDRVPGDAAAEQAFDLCLDDLDLHLASSSKGRDNRPADVPNARRPSGQPPRAAVRRRRTLRQLSPMRD